MKEEINLLPQQAQRQRRHRVYIKHLQHLARRTQLMLGLLFGLLVVLYLSVISLMPKRSTLLPLAATNQQEYESYVSVTNEFLGAIAERASTNRPWTPQLRDVMRLLPTTLQLTGVAVEEDKDKLVIHGLAQERAGLTAFEKHLQELPWVESVESPLSNFATGQRAGFTFKVSRKVAPGL